MRKFLLYLSCTILLTFSSIFSFSQDTIRVFQYNILRYGDNCGDLSKKDNYLKDIFLKYKPDVIGINEMADDDIYAQRILKNSLNVNGISKYKKVAFTNKANSGLVNMLFYNSEKLTFHSQYVSNTLVRDINHYRFYYHSVNNPSQDTAFLNFIVMHLKAGSGSDDETDRSKMITNMMNSLNDKKISENYLAMGDFNIQSSSEISYQKLINPTNSSVIFTDPILKSGTWHNNSTFAPFHTQSTRTDYLSDCGVPGGMDDRFDFILISDDIETSKNGISYISGSYTTPGNDGDRFNKSLNSAGNNSLPSYMLNALENMSDHLPIFLDLLVDKKYTTQLPFSETNSFASVYPTVVKDNFHVAFNQKEAGEIRISDITGKLIFKSLLKNGINTFNLSTYKSGVYLVTIKDNKGGTVIRKLIKAKH